MPHKWSFSHPFLNLGGGNSVSVADSVRQEKTACEILSRLNDQPGVILADEVGMGKTFVALSVASSVLLSQAASERRPVVVMVPPGLVSKWRRDWEYFRALCVRRGSELDTIRVAEVRSATDLFRELDGPPSGRARLILMSMTAYSGALSDRWIQLAMVRLAKGTTRLDAESRNRLEKWAASLVRLKSQKALSPEVVGRLMITPLSGWQSILEKEKLFQAGSTARIPSALEDSKLTLDLSPIVQVLKNELPNRRGKASKDRVREASSSLSAACQQVYRQWLGTVEWRSPLLILDEAHHAKNDKTRLARLFRTSGDAFLEGEKPTLADKFDRLLLLTATPFQLGHNELARVLRTFSAANWSGAHAPTRSRTDFLADVDELERRLDANRLAAKSLDRAWGRLTPAVVATRTDVEPEQTRDAATVAEWFMHARAANDRGEALPVERETILSFERCVLTRDVAQACSMRPWASLSAWLIRHNRPNSLTIPTGSYGIVPRRSVLPGRAIEDEDLETRKPSGLGFGGADALAFLLAARAQGEMSSRPKARPLKFAEGLCSSFEAFHHTRQSDESIVDEEASGEIEAVSVEQAGGSLIPMSWYADRIAEHIPGADDDDARSHLHPKVRVVVNRVVDLWERGEKSLVFCFYRQTSRALSQHIEKALEQRIKVLARVRTGSGSDAEGLRLVNRLAERIGDPKSPFHALVRDELHRVLAQPQWDGLAKVRDQLLELLLAYTRSVPFLVRVLPVNDGQMRQALEYKQSDRAIIAAACAVLQGALRALRGEHGLSLERQATQFLAFASELHGRSEARDATNLEADESSDPLDDYLRAISIFARRADGVDESGYKTVFRAEKPVRMVNGSTPMDTRDRVMLAFNSPMFPEILVSSKVLAEGVDLHRFCRHVIHHDLDWNPSMLEQRTGRLDRIRCRAEAVSQPIMVYEPFIAGSADERMYRVVKDRERWFQIVMGQKYEFDEGMAEDIAERVTLPEVLSRQLVFSLSVAGA